MNKLIFTVLGLSISTFALGGVAPAVAVGINPAANVNKFQFWIGDEKGNKLGTRQFDLSQFTNKDGDIELGPITFGQFGDEKNGVILQLDKMKGKFDPVLLNAFTIIDIGTPNTFKIESSMLIAPISAPAKINTYISGVYADQGTDGGSIAPFTTATIGTFDVNGTFFSAANAGPGVTFPGGGTFTYPLGGGAYTGMANVDCSTLSGGQCTSISTLASFIGPGGGDAVSLVLRNEITIIPEPLTILGTATALAFGAMLKRKNAFKKETE